MPFDYSTLNLNVLRKLPTYKLPRTYHLQKDHGNGCYGDPPGYPTYFTKSVYTQYGNSPRKGAEQVVEYEGVLYVTQWSEWKPGETWEKRHEKYNALMRRLWIPLPVDHPRTIAWIHSQYTHSARCWVPEDGNLRLDKLEQSGPPERYQPTVLVQKFYPDHTYDTELAASPPKRYAGDWWELEAVRPTPETCKPPSWLNGGEHPSGRDWCQHCGWHAEDAS
jgi:hypothetical protein